MASARGLELELALPKWLFIHRSAASMLLGFTLSTWCLRLQGSSSGLCLVTGYCTAYVLADFQVAEYQLLGHTRALCRTATVNTFTVFCWPEWTQSPPKPKGVQKQTPALNGTVTRSHCRTATDGRYCGSHLWKIYPAITRLQTIFGFFTAPFCIFQILHNCFCK